MVCHLLPFAKVGQSDPYRNLHVSAAVLLKASAVTLLPISDTLIFNLNNELSITFLRGDLRIKNVNYFLGFSVHSFARTKQFTRCLYEMQD